MEICQSRSAFVTSEFAYLTTLAVIELKRATMVDQMSSVAHKRAKISTDTMSASSMRNLDVSVRYKLCFGPGERSNCRSRPLVSC